jgi:hypothetical protein
MGIPIPFTREKLVVGVLISQRELKGELQACLMERFGAVDYESELMEFSYTHYYDEEMGKPILRFFLSFKRLCSPDRLSEVKIQTNSLEDMYRDRGMRRINLDPGILSLSRFILATTKDGSHRIPLRSGIYGEVTLVFEHGEFRPLPWTYPDYSSETYRNILKQIRREYRDQLR